jgi:hypothetical protein
MDEDIEILEDLAEQVTRTADNASYKLAKLREKSLHYNGKKIADDIETMTRVRDRLRRQAQAIRAGIASLQNEGDPK